jgi:hypothetical protein
MLSPLLVSFICFSGAILATTIITTYTDSDCAEIIGSITGPDTGVCQENSLGSYTGFQVTSLDSSCAGMVHPGMS